jgi:hypothetical protein
VLNTPSAFIEFWNAKFTFVLGRSWRGLVTSGINSLCRKQYGLPYVANVSFAESDKQIVCNAIDMIQFAQAA